MTLDEIQQRSERIRRDLKAATYRHDPAPSAWQLADTMEDMMVLIDALIARAVTTGEDRP